MKKNVVIYATCQGMAIAKFLKESEEFNNYYNIEYIFQAQTYVSGHKNSDQIKECADAIANADVFIFQPIKDEYYIHSTKYHLSKIKPECRTISMPFVYNTSTWPIAPILKRDFMEVYIKEGNELVLVNHEAIDNLILRKMSSCDIIESYCNNTMDFYYEKRFRHELSMLKVREAELNVKVAGFIEDNISKKRLFLSCSHPTSVLFEYMSNQILVLLGLSTLRGMYPLDYANITACGIPIPYPTSSIDHFKFEFDNEGSKEIADPFYRDLIISYLINHKRV